MNEVESAKVCRVTSNAIGRLDSRAKLFQAPLDCSITASKRERATWGTRLSTAKAFRIKQVMQKEPRGEAKKAKADRKKSVGQRGIEGLEKVSRRGGDSWPEEGEDLGRGGAASHGPDRGGYGA